MDSEIVDSSDVSRPVLYVATVLSLQQSLLVIKFLMGSEAPHICINSWNKDTPPSGSTCHSLLRTTPPAQYFYLFPSTQASRIMFSVRFPCSYLHLFSFSSAHCGFRA
jgi:hypothetical protein